MQLDSICNAFMNENKAQAMRVCIHEKGKEVYNYSGGEDHENLLYSIGSVSKIFTTVMVLKLVEDGKVDLDKPVSTYLSNLHLASDMDNKMTVRTLLNHSCGVAGNCYREKYGNQVNRKHTTQCIDYVNEMALKDEPGLYSVYCNDGFSLAEALIEEVSGKTFANYATEVILKPCDMKHIDFPIHALEEGMYLPAESPFDLRFPQEYVNGIASGGMYSTANDICKFYNHLMKGMIIHPDLFHEMNQLQAVRKLEISHYSDETYGLGWDEVYLPLFEQYNLHAYAKSGGTFGFSTHSIMIPELELSIATTLSSKQGSVVTINSKILLAYLKEHYEFKKQELPKKVLQCANIEKYEGVYGYRGGVLRLEKGEIGYILSLDVNGTWESKYHLTLLKDGGLCTEDKTFFQFKEAKVWVVDADETQYLLVTTQHVLDADITRFFVYAQKLQPSYEEMEEWNALDGHIYLMEDEWLYERTFDHQPMLLRPHHLRDYENLLIVSHPLLQKSSTEACNVLSIPGSNGREIGNVKRINENVLQYGMYHYRKSDDLPYLRIGEYRFFDELIHWYELDREIEEMKFIGNARVIGLNQDGIVLFDSLYMNGLHNLEDVRYIGMIMDEEAQIHIEFAKKS